MARLRSSRIIKWAGVEFQPNLVKPVKPVRLGAILFEESTSSMGVAVTGRTPRLDSRPKEFDGVGAVTMSLAANWVDNMFKDILEGGDTNIFDLLAKRWRWNLYLIEPKALRPAELQGTFETIAKKIYERFVGQPFEAIKPTKTKLIPKHAPKLARAREIPPAWQLEALKRQSMNLTH